MKDMGAASKILVIDIIRNMKEGTLRLSQTRYVDKVIQRFRMADAKVVSTPMGAHFKLISIIDEIGSLDPEVFPYSSAVCSVMYAMIGTRPDVAYAMGLVSRFMSRPGEMHWEAVKWILRYLKGLRDLNFVFTKGANLEVQGYCDSDHAADLDRRRSISGSQVLLHQRHHRSW